MPKFRLFLIILFLSYHEVNAQNLSEIGTVKQKYPFWNPMEILLSIKTYDPWLIYSSCGDKDLENELRDMFFSGIELIENEKYIEAIEKLKRAKMKFEIFRQSYFLNQTNLWIAFAHQQLNKTEASTYYLDNLNYRSILPVTLLFAGDLYYRNGEKKRSIKIYKQILEQDSDNLEACSRLYKLYNEDHSFSTKARKYKARYEQIVIDKQNEKLLSEDLDIEINELKQVN